MYLDTAATGVVIVPPKNPVVPPTGEIAGQIWLVTLPVVAAGAAVAITNIFPAISGG
jgi:hypothetical protein